MLYGDDSVLEHDELRSQFERKERECEAKIQEKEELMKTLNILKSKLDSETQEKLGANQKLGEMVAHAETLRQTVSYLRLIERKFGLRMWQQFIIRF